LEFLSVGLRSFLEATRPDELMITAHIHDQPARLRSLEQVAQVRDKLPAARGEKAASA
jgi:hypothetical protein